MQYIQLMCHKLKGMFLGDLEDGELEIGQVSALIHDIKPAVEIIKEMMSEFDKRKEEVTKF